MDIKGIAWVGNIYQKFEAMCLEVEEAMCQDLLPPSSKDLSRVASHDLSLNPYLEIGIHKKPISSIKEDAIDPVCIKGISVKKSNSSNDVWEDWYAASFNWEISDNDEANCDRIDVQASNEATVCESRGQQEGQMCNLTVDASFVSSPPGTTVFTKSSSTDTCENSELVSQMGSQATSNTSSSLSIDEDVPHADPCENSRSVSFSKTHSDIRTNTHCGQPAGNEVVPSHTGTSAECNPDLEEENKNDTTVKLMEPIEHESESGFEETCVLVDGNDYRPDNHKPEIRRSYKKKIQSAFSLKNKSLRKQEYKQLAAQYGKFNTELDIHGDEAVPLALALSKNIKSKKLATNDSIESEWELL